jgi:hypothetical protein
MRKEHISSSVKWKVSVVSQVKCHKALQTLILLQMHVFLLYPRKDEDICVYYKGKWISICSQDVATDITVICKMWIVNCTRDFVCRSIDISHLYRLFSLRRSLSFFLKAWKIVHRGNTLWINTSVSVINLRQNSAIRINLWRNAVSKTQVYISSN